MREIQLLGGETMRNRRSVAWALVALLVVPLLLAACGGEAEHEAATAAVVEEVDGTDLSKITLTPEAAERLDVKTAAVTASGAGKVIPYAAVFYSPDGETWAYTNPEGLTFVREQIIVDRVEGDRAMLSKGPAAGSKVATAGVAELYGAESGIDDTGH
jgi:hypothetical protein